MATTDRTTPEWARWRSHFAEVIIGGDRGEIDAATEGAVAAIRQGANDAEAKQAGRDALRRHRSRWNGATADHPPPPQPGPGGSAPRWDPPTGPPRPPSTPTERRAAWVDLATPLFSPPERWGWRAADLPVPGPPPPDLAQAQRPAWVEPPRPDTSHLAAARSRAVTKLVWRIAFGIVLVVAFLAFQGVAEQNLRELQQQQEEAENASDVYQVVILVAGGLLAISLVRAALRVGSANRALRAFEQPYLAFRSSERQRHQQALADWEDAVRRHQAAVARATRPAGGPRWFPVRPASDPTRIDVVGGDSRRHGWAGLLVTLGTSVLAGGHRLTVLDLTGQDVGGGLLGVARARGLGVRRIDLPDDGFEVSLLEGLTGPEIAECLAYALTGRLEPGDQRQERAFVNELLALVIRCLDGWPTLDRIARGVDVLRQVALADPLPVEETNRLADHIGELAQDEWTGRQMRFVASQLRALDGMARRDGLPPTGTGIAGTAGTAGPGGTAGTRPLWATEQVSLVTTAGGPDDRKDLLDRLLLQLTQRALHRRGQLDGVLVVAGADHLGAAELDVLSEHALTADVRLVLMIDQPQGELEKALGTGGAVCIMKMYNHRDATIAAEFVGRGYKFVLSQLSYQVGKTFTDGGGDNFAANTGQGSSTKQGSAGRGKGTDLSDSRGHAWTGVRNWSTADNLSDSRTSSRVHEFTVEPQQILGMPETAFILVDNSGQGRRVVMADSNPGICLLPDISPTPD